MIYFGASVVSEVTHQGELLLCSLICSLGTFLPLRPTRLSNLLLYYWALDLEFPQKTLAPVFQEQNLDF